MVKIYQYITRGENEITDNIFMSVGEKNKARRKLSS